MISCISSCPRPHLPASDVTGLVTEGTALRLPCRLFRWHSAVRPDQPVRPFRLFSWTCKESALAFGIEAIGRRQPMLAAPPAVNVRLPAGRPVMRASLKLRRPKFGRFCHCFFWEKTGSRLLRNILYQSRQTRRTIRPLPPAKNDLADGIWQIWVQPQSVMAAKARKACHCAVSRWLVHRSANPAWDGPARQQASAIVAGQKTRALWLCTWMRQRRGLVVVPGRLRRPRRILR